VILVLSALALGVVVVRRRSVAIALVAAQSLVLGVIALVDGLGESAALATAGVALLAKAVALPALLIWVVARTREPRLIVEERHALARAVAAAAVTLVLVELVPDVGLDGQDGAVALLALGVSIAVLRRATIFQALGFLVAENARRSGRAAGGDRDRARVRPRRGRRDRGDVQRPDPRAAGDERHRPAGGAA
jgi:hydrogenase-4 membrane subunit HyfE